MFDFKTPLRHWSLWLSGAGTAALGLALVLPETALRLWTDDVPDELKAVLPPQTELRISLFLLIASILARFIRQKDLCAAIGKLLKGGLT
jgi:hypothetical protein